jgi:hypothetical protein
MAAKPPFAANAQVEHSKFGPGTVLNCTDQHVVIKFDDGNERKFLLEIAREMIKKIDRQPPEAKKRSSKKAKAAPAAAAVAE